MFSAQKAESMDSLDKDEENPIQPARCHQDPNADSSHSPPPVTSAERICVPQNCTEQRTEDACFVTERRRTHS